MATTTTTKMSRNGVKNAVGGSIYVPHTHRLHEGNVIHSTTDGRSDVASWRGIFDRLDQGNCASAISMRHHGYTTGSPRTSNLGQNDNSDSFNSLLLPESQSLAVALDSYLLVVVVEEACCPQQTKHHHSCQGYAGRSSPECQYQPFDFKNLQ